MSRVRLSISIGRIEISKNMGQNLIPSAVQRITSQLMLFFALCVCLRARTTDKDWASWIWITSHKNCMNTKPNETFDMFTELETDKWWENSKKHIVCASSLFRIADYQNHSAPFLSLSFFGLLLDSRMNFDRNEFKEFFFIMYTKCFSFSFNSHRWWSFNASMATSPR